MFLTQKDLNVLYANFINYILISSENHEIKFDGKVFGRTVFVTNKSLLKY